MEIKKKCKKIYIFGAHSRAQTLAVYLCALYPELSVAAYLVDNDEKNPEEVEGVSVIHLTYPENNGTLNKNIPVFLGTQGKFHETLTAKLDSLGFRHIYPVTPELDMKLRNRYFEQYFRGIGRTFAKIDSMPDNGEIVDNTYGVYNANETNDADCSACIYVVKSVYDKQLKQTFEMTSYEREIQVGAALTEKRLSDGILTDDTGDNISKKNSQYCELTALYWIWKNATEEIVGLSHYRRHFILPHDWVRRMQKHRIDVILPTPLYVAPSLAGNFKERHDPAVWACMMDVLKERGESQLNEAETFFQGNLYSPCNMLIARKNALDALCSWLFPILDAVAERQGQKEDRYQNRYPGFLSERLMSFFFEKNRDKCRVVYADKNFLP